MTLTDQVQQPQRHLGIMSDQRLPLVSGQARLLAPHRFRRVMTPSPQKIESPDTPGWFNHARHDSSYSVAYADVRGAVTAR
jgi:hypothetical protein